MNKSLVVGALFGAAVATAAGGFAGYKMLSTPEYADVVAVTAVTERVETPREECHDQVVTRKKPVKDQHKITGTVIGAVAGGLLGDDTAPNPSEASLAALGSCLAVGLHANAVHRGWIVNKLELQLERLAAAPPADCVVGLARFVGTEQVAVVYPRRHRHRGDSQEEERKAP